MGQSRLGLLELKIAFQFLGHDERPRVTSLHLHMIFIPSPQLRWIAGQRRLAVSAAGVIAARGGWVMGEGLKAAVHWWRQRRKRRRRENPGHDVDATARAARLDSELRKQRWSSGSGWGA